MSAFETEQQWTREQWQAYYAEAVAAAQDLIDHGVPVIVCTPNLAWTPEPACGVPELWHPPGWDTITADQCDLSAFRPGVDTLAMVSGHGVDVVDEDPKNGGTLDNLPPFRRFGLHTTPSGGRHAFVRSTGIGKMSLSTSDGPVGDYCGGTVTGGSRLLCYLPGSSRPKYAGGQPYKIVKHIDLDALFEHEPDDELIAALVGAGGTFDGEAGQRAATRGGVQAFLAEHSEVPQPASQCRYGRQAMSALTSEGLATKVGRHAWAVRAACRAVELCRTGCATAADVDALGDVLAKIKPEGGSHWPSILAWAVTNATGQADCGLHGPNARPRRDQLDGLIPTGAPASSLTAPTPAPGPTAAAADQPPSVGSPLAAAAARALVGDTYTPGDTWATVDLTDIIDGIVAGTIDRPKPTIGRMTDGGALFYRGRVNGVAGASNSAKTWTALHAAAQSMNDGEHAFYIDLEDDAVGITTRLIQMGVQPDVIREFFHYTHPDEALDVVAEQRLLEGLTRWKPAIVVIDSTGESMALDRAKPNDDDDVARWFHRLPTPIAVITGAAVVLLDHVVKAEDEAGLWPIGSQRKRAAIRGAQYIQKPERPWKKGADGQSVIICAKDRQGTYCQGEKVARLTGKSTDPVTGDLDVELIPTDGTPDDAGRRGDFRPTTLMQRISDHLSATGGPKSTRALTKDEVAGKEPHLVVALRTLVTEGYVAVEIGPRNARMHTLVKPYDQRLDPRSDIYRGDRDADRPTVSPPSPDCLPETVTTTVSPSPTVSTKGDGGTGDRRTLTGSPERPSPRGRELQKCPACRSALTTRKCPRCGAKFKRTTIAGEMAYLDVTSNRTYDITGQLVTAPGEGGGQP